MTINKHDEILQRLTKVETIVKERFDALEARLPKCIGLQNSQEIKTITEKVKGIQKINWFLLVTFIGITIRIIVTTGS